MDIAFFTCESVDSLVEVYRRTEELDYRQHAPNQELRKPIKEASWTPVGERENSGAS